MIDMELGNRHFEAWIEADLPSELEHMDRKFEVHQAPGAELHVQRALRWFVSFDLGAHFHGISDDVRGFPGLAKDLGDQARGTLADFGGAEDRPGPAQRHMLPRPGFFALVALERVERDDEHALRSFGPEPRVHVVKRAGGRRHAERRGDPARQAVEIVIRAERLWAVRSPFGSSRMQINEVEVGGVRQLAPSQPAKPENKQLRSGKTPMHLFKLANRSFAERQQGTFRNPSIARRNLERVAPLVDQLYAERKSPLVHQSPGTIQ